MRFRPAARMLLRISDSGLPPSGRFWARPRGLSAPIVFALLAALLGSLAQPAGAYEVGHSRTVYVDPARNNRQIDTEVYYPADLPGENVPVATPPAGGFPVIAFGHGFVMAATDYDFLWEGLVPEGYVICLPRTEGGFSPSHIELGRDLAFLCLRLQAAGADPGSPFFGKISTASAVAGHSMGGGASFLGAAAEPAITALFNLAAAETNPSAIAAAAQITIPALLFAGSLDCVTPPADHQRPMYAALSSGCKAYAELLGASHCQFAEYNFLCGLGETGCPAPTITRAQQHQTTLDLLSPWLDHVLRGNSQAWNEFVSLLTSHSGITYLLDCPAADVAELAPQPAGAQVRLAALGHAFPNPAVGRVSIAFQLQRPAAAALLIADAAGRRVRRLTLPELGRGWHQAVWDGADEAGSAAPPGCYFCRLEQPSAGGTVKILLLR